MPQRKRLCAFSADTPWSPARARPGGEPKAPPFTYHALTPHPRFLCAQRDATNAPEPARSRPRTPWTRAFMGRTPFRPLHTTRESQTSSRAFALLWNAPCAHYYQERSAGTPRTRHDRASAMAGPRLDVERPRPLQSARRGRMAPCNLRRGERSQSTASCERGGGARRRWGDHGHRRRAALPLSGVEERE